ncbi:MAG: DUF4926 domain-containing protein [Dehalococcoidia bacterium]
MPEHGLQVGDVGTVVHVVQEGKAYLVEFFTLDGETIDVVMLEADQVRPAGGEEIAHARPLSIPQAGD